MPAMVDGDKRRKKVQDMPRSIHETSIDLPTLRELGQRFATLREQEGISADDVAARIAVGSDVLEDFEVRGIIDSEYLIRLIGAYSLSTDLEAAFLATRSSGLPRTIGEIVEAWGRGAIDTPAAIQRGGFEGYADLLEAAVTNGIPLRTELTEREKRQAQIFIQLMQEG